MLASEAGRHTRDAQATELEPALELALQLEHAQMGLLLVPDDAGTHLLPALSEGLTPEECAQFGRVKSGEGPIGAAFAERKRVSLQDIMQSDVADDLALSELRIAARRLGFRSLLVLPLALQDDPPVGVLALMFRRARGPNGKADRLLALCVQSMAVGIHSMRLREVAERKCQRIEDLSRAKIHFFARMSHELRTPLQSIAGYVDLLRLGVRGRVTPAQAELLARVENSEQLLLSVIDDLITFSRIEVGRIEYHLGPVAAADAVVAAEMVVSPIAKGRGVALQVDRCDPAVCVHADSDKLRQILVNLLANALKFTPARGSVHLSCRVDDHAVYFTVTDTGPGIPVTKLHDIFQPFVQLGVPLLDGLGGSGLGLAISREFASGMGGDINVESIEGKGATFTVSLKRLPNLMSRLRTIDAAALPDESRPQSPEADEPVTVPVVVET